MALRSFRIENRRSVRLAEAISVPPVMVIAGPNGVGKSTILYAIKEVGAFDENTKVLYQGPHRVLRKTTVRRSWLGGVFKGFQELLSGADVSNYEGLSFGDTARTPENVDEAGSTIKHTLGKIENRHQNAITTAVQRLKAAGSGTLALDTLPDIYEPLRKLTEFLLPHLRFERMDFSNENNIKCVFNRTQGGTTFEVDIDDLSSGEKAVIVLFLPLLEDQIEARLQSLSQLGVTPAYEAAVTEEAPESLVVLIDEPELHLHPDLQAKILTFMRTTTQETSTQFVITSHSPTILDQAFDSELFVMNELANGAVENQLKQVATNAERLEALKQLAGSAYFLTTGRVLVCIEGEPDVDPEKPTDARLLGILYPRAAAVTLVPSKGRSTVITTVQRLREHVPEDTFRIRVRGIVDADQSDTTVTGIEVLPVCMIENLLLDPESILEHLRSVGITTFADAAAVETELRSIAREQREKEIDLRLRRKLKPQMVRIGGATIEAVKAKHAEVVTEVNGMLPDDATLGTMIAETVAAVDAILTGCTELDHFRGKAILEIFHQRHLAPLSLGYNSMCIDVAKRVATKGTIVTKLDPVFDRIMNS
jgi:predicted ATPase